MRPTPTIHQLPEFHDCGLDCFDDEVMKHNPAPADRRLPEPLVPPEFRTGYLGRLFGDNRYQPGKHQR